MYKKVKKKKFVDNSNLLLSTCMYILYIYICIKKNLKKLGRQYLYIHMYKKNFKKKLGRQ